MYSAKEKVAAYLARTSSTKKELASALGMSTNTLNAKLDGETDWTLTEGIVLARLLGCEVDDLRAGKYAPTP